MNKIAYKIKKYKDLKADVTDIDITIQELEENQTEENLKEKERLLKLKSATEREIARIDNAMSVLNEEEQYILKTILIEKRKYILIEMKLNLTYSRIKQIEKKAIKKIEKYLA